MPARGGFESLCFDFDGTLVDSSGPAYAALRLVAPSFGCRVPDEAEFAALRAGHARRLLKRLGVPFYRLPSFVARMRAAMRAELMGVAPIDGMRETLEQLARRGCRLCILSSNARESILAYLECQGLAGFDRVIGDCPLFGKARLLRRLAREPGVGRMLYVGDELRDLEAARKARVAFAGVAWGFTEARVLRAGGPDLWLERPGDLLEQVRG
ncbi:MAG: HAD hydrolase-like protein [Chromatiaceae bacterium]|nr:HAD hydrolase-like protein [Chromatiaceae bacterium]